MKILIKYLSVLLIVSAFARCQNKHNKRIHDDLAQKISMADSLGIIVPETAQTIYLQIIREGANDNRVFQTEALLGLSVVLTNSSKFDSALLVIENAGQIAHELNDTLLLMKYYNSKGEYFNKKENFDETEKCFTSGLHLAEMANNEPIRHTFLLNLGQVLINKGNYPEAMKTFTTELKHCEGTGNEEYQSIALQNMAGISILTGDHHEAIRLTKKSLAIQKKLNLMQDYADQLQNLGICYKNIGIYDSAVMFYRQALDILSQSGDSLKMIRVQYNMGNLLKNQKKYAEAEKEMKEIIRFCKRNEIFSGYAMALSSLATIYARTNRIDKGIAAIDSSLLLAKMNNLITLIVPFYDIKHSLCADIGKYSEAYHVLKMQQQISDSLLSLDKQKEILALKTRYETEKKETENELLKKENEVQKSRFWLLLMGLVVGILAFSVLIYSMYHRQKQIIQQKLLSDEKTMRVEQEKRNKEIELEKIQMQKQVQDQELVFQSLIRADLVQINRSVKEKLSPFKMVISRKKDQDDFAKALSELTRDAARDPIAEFELVFKQLHTSFYKKLLQICPTLSKAELQVCALLRLNLSTKDIARLTHLNITTIEITRHHIRKKLKLEQADMLTTFLISV